MSDVEEIRIEPLDSGFIVSVIRDGGGYTLAHRTAEATLTGAIGIAARALGYHGTIEFGTRTVEVPVVGMTTPGLGIPFDDEEGVRHPLCVDGLEEKPYTRFPVVDDDEPPLRAGTARPDDLL